MIYIEKDPRKRGVMTKRINMTASNAQASPMGSDSYTKAESDAKFALKGQAPDLSNFYTKQQADQTFANSRDLQLLIETLYDNFSQKGDSYTMKETDVRFVRKEEVAGYVTKNELYAQIVQMRNDIMALKARLDSLPNFNAPKSRFR